MKRNRPRKKQNRNSKGTAKHDQFKSNVDWEPLIIIAIMGGLFSGSFAVSGSSWLLGLVLGCFIAFAGLPYFDPKKWKPRPYLTGFLGGSLGCLLAVTASASFEGILIFGLVGGVIGFFALHWVPHVSI